MISLKPSSAGSRPVGTVRQLRPSDLPRFEAHLMRLDMAGRRDRFNGPTSDAFLASYARRCFHDGTTVIGLVDDDGSVLGAAELHERPELADTGEIAFSVESRSRRQGVGRRLFERLILHAHALGYVRLLVTTHPQNEAMKRLARGFNARLTFSEGETVGVIGLDGAVDLDYATSAGSRMRGGTNERRKV
jgi:RimJ/RimL family protein N-acetyltransferase